MKSLIAVVVFVLMFGVCYAGDTSIGVAVSSFVWTEQGYKESGILESANVEYVKSDCGWLRLHGEFYYGAINFSGTSAEGRYSFKDLYYGLRSDVLYGPKYKTEYGDVILFGGIGFEWFDRDKRYMNTINPSYYEEDWMMLKAKIGSRYEYKMFFIEGGIEYPFYIHETLLGETLHPQGEINPFIEIGVTYKPWSVSAYYENIRIGESSAQMSAYASNHTVSQPAANADLITIKISYTF